MIAQATIRQNKKEIIAGLQSEILRIQGFKTNSNSIVDVGLGPIYNSFPGNTFPIGAVHEFLSSGKENAASSFGFVAGLLSSLTGKSGTIVWVSSSRNIFPPALKSFGIEPDLVIFIDLQNEKDTLWVMEEALKCGAVSAVVGELKEIGFTESRRLQLAVEKSQVTGFILRKPTKNVNTTACVSRWKITSLRSESIDNLPGIGFPKWRVELLKIRNGKPGAWDLQWINGKFVSSNHSNVSSGISEGVLMDRHLASGIEFPASSDQHRESSIQQAS